MALTNVDTPLKGGANTDLRDGGGDFASVTPSQSDIRTPNTVLSTPYRTKDGQVHMTPSARTPGGAGTPGATPLRDKLAINPDDSFETGDRYQQREMKETLKMGLSSLPAPKNDFEIVVPDDEDGGADGDGIDGYESSSAVMVEDQSDVDRMTEEEFRKRRMAELKRRSQAVQRDLPRPTDMNDSVLRPLNADPPLTDLQRAEELIKREMMVMMHHDCVETPTPAQMGEGGSSNKSKKKEEGGTKSILNEQAHRAYLDRHPYQQFTEEEMEEAKNLLKDEMSTVKTGMQHGDLSLEAYTQVWEECLAQVLFLPGQSRYTRASLASKKDRIESMRSQLESNRGHMTKEAKRAAKIEKKLKVLTGGYQARAQGLIKQINDTQDQIEQARLELSTFGFLKDQETAAIPRRLDSVTEDVEKQRQREAELQTRFQEARDKIGEMQPQPY